MIEPVTVANDSYAIQPVERKKRTYRDWWKDNHELKQLEMFKNGRDDYTKLPMYFNYTWQDEVSVALSTGQELSVFGANRTKEEWALDSYVLPTPEPVTLMDFQSQIVNEALRQDILEFEAGHYKYRKRKLPDGRIIEEIIPEADIIIPDRSEWDKEMDRRESKDGLCREDRNVGPNATLVPKVIAKVAGRKMSIFNFLAILNDTRNAVYVWWQRLDGSELSVGNIETIDKEKILLNPCERTRVEFDAVVVHSVCVKYVVPESSPRTTTAKCRSAQGPMSTHEVGQIKVSEIIGPEVLPPLPSEKTKLSHLVSTGLKEHRIQWKKRKRSQTAYPVPEYNERLVYYDSEGNILDDERYYNDESEPPAKKALGPASLNARQESSLHSNCAKYFIPGLFVLASWTIVLSLLERQRFHNIPKYLWASQEPLMRT